MYQVIGSKRSIIIFSNPMIGNIIIIINVPDAELIIKKNCFNIYKKKRIKRISS